MLRSRVVVGVLSAGLTMIGASAACAQDYPSRPIRIITAPAGGGGDVVSRILAEGISGPLGQPVIVDNRPAILLGEIGAKATPDGYSILVLGGSFTIGPLLQKQPYDPEKDFAPVVMIGVSPNILVIHPSVAAKSVKELIALAKAKPGALSYASTSIGGSAHLAAELFRSMAGINLLHVPYKGAPAALTAIISGEVQVLFPGIPAATPHLKAGRLTGLAVTSAKPSALAPGVPTIAASGLPGYEATSMDGVYAPANTPRPIINRLNQEIVRVITRPDVKEKFFGFGLEVTGGTPEQLAAAVRSEIATWSKVIKEAGLRAN